MISFWISLLLLSASFSAAETPPSVAKRDGNSGIICQSGGFCQAWYQTGNPQCQSGYKRFELEVGGYQPGSVCERRCNDAELKTCFNNNCKLYQQECLKGGDSTSSTTASLCRTALEFCDGPISMANPKVCTSSNMQQHVKWNDTDRKCHPTLVIRKGATFSTYVYPKDHKNKDRRLLGCFPLSMKGASQMATAIRQLNRLGNAIKMTDVCEYDDLNAYCQLQKPFWDTIENWVRNHCHQAQSNDGVPPHFFKTNYERARGKGN